MGDFRLRKKERITKKTEFQTIIKQGTRYTTKNFTIIIHRNKRDTRRLGISVSKKVGEAVKRNRVKRLVREFFRLHKDQLPEFCDFLFIAKSGSIQLNYSTLCEEMLAFIKHFSVTEPEGGFTP